MQYPSITYKRLQTRAVTIGNLTIGGNNPIAIQTMTTTDTMDTDATVAQSIRCIQAGAQLVRITAPSQKEAYNLQIIKDKLRAAGYQTPLVADIHFTPNAAEIAAGIVEKVRVNPGNYVDKKKFDFIEYTNEAYQEEIERIEEKFLPLVLLCKKYGTAMRIGTNHGSLSDRIMSRYGDTAIGMVESAMEFLRIARKHDYNQIVLSMKSSNPIVMVDAYRTLVQHMQQEFGECYPLHLGVTEAGDGEDGRIKSAVGIGTLLAEGIGDTVRVSLTEDPEFEIPICMDLVKPYNSLLATASWQKTITNARPLQNLAFEKQAPYVIADASHLQELTPNSLKAFGYAYNEQTDKWSISDAAADFLFVADKAVNFALPGTLKIIVNHYTYGLSNYALNPNGPSKFFPLFELSEYVNAPFKHQTHNYVMVDCFSQAEMLNETIASLQLLQNDQTVILCLSSQHPQTASAIAEMVSYLREHKFEQQIVFIADSLGNTIDEHLISLSTQLGGLLMQGVGSGICLGAVNWKLENTQVTGRTYLAVNSLEQFLNNTAFTLLQATRRRISKTEYISCPSCGRTLFDLQETTATIRKVTNHLKGVKIAIMGCIVNGPGEMADADFGYVGSGVGKITLYKSKEVVKRNIPAETAVDELINLLKENNVWLEPPILA
jgi:(E)-4-hydroxy-3-methylbut-2-enyl-diphosphate synthase